jgi:hypothetical protein
MPFALARHSSLQCLPAQIVAGKGTGRGIPFEVLVSLLATEEMGEEMVGLRA